MYHNHKNNNLYFTVIFAILMLQSSCNNQSQIGMSTTNKNEILIKKTYAKEFQLNKNDIKVKVIDHVEIPEIVVFSATPDPKKLGRNTVRNGIVQANVIYYEQEAMQHIAKAWNYGQNRTVNASQFASVIGFLNDANHSSSAIVDQETLDVFKSVATPKKAQAATLPKEIMVDGKPAVIYALQSAASSKSFALVTAVVAEDFKVTLHTQPIYD